MKKRFAFFLFFVEDSAIFMIKRFILSKRYSLAGLGGILAIFLWSTNIAFSKSVIQKEGLYNTAFYLFFFSGIFTIFLLLLIFKAKILFQKISQLPLSYYYSSGFFFFLSISLLIIAIGMVSKSEELLIITILNYTWPILIYVLKIPILKARFKKVPLTLGIVLSFCGTILAVAHEYDYAQISLLIEAGGSNLVAYFLAFLNSVCWAIYCNLTIKHHTKDDIAGVPILFIITGTAFLLLQIIRGELSTIHLTALFENKELLYMIAGPTSLAYFLWYLAIKHGNRNLVSSLSFFIPLLSVMMISLLFEVKIGMVFLSAIFLLISGSYLCYKSFQ